MNPADPMLAAPVAHDLAAARAEVDERERSLAAWQSSAAASAEEAAALADEVESAPASARAALAARLDDTRQAERHAREQAENLARALERSRARLLRAEAAAARVAFEAREAARCAAVDEITAEITTFLASIHGAAARFREIEARLDAMRDVVPELGHFPSIASMVPHRMRLIVEDAFAPQTSARLFNPRPPIPDPAQRFRTDLEAEIAKARASINGLPPCAA